MQASTKLNNLAGDMQILGTSINVALIKAGASGNDVLRNMAGWATGAVNAFGGLPAPVLASGLNIAALAAAGLILGGAFITIVPKIAATSAALNTVTIAGVSAKSALMGLGTAGGTLVGVAAISTQLDQYSGQSMVATVETKKLAGALTDFANGGKDSVEFERVFVQQGKAFGHSVNSNAEAMTRCGDAAGLALRGDWLSWLVRMDDGGVRAAAFTKQANQLDAALTSMAQGGQGPAASKVFKQLSDAMTNQGLSVDQVTKTFPLYAAAVTSGAAAAKTAALSADDLARSSEKTTVALVAMGGKADATDSAMQILGAGADAASTAVKDLAKSIQTDMDAAAKAFTGDMNVLGNYDPSKKGNLSLADSYKADIALASKFATDIAAVTKAGLDPNVIAKLLAEGPAKAEPALQSMLSGNTSTMIKMVNQGEASLAAINQRVIEQARLTSMAVNSQSHQMSKDFSAAMQIDNAIATSGGKATVASLAAQLHLGAGDVKRVAAEFGIGIADGVAGGVTPAKVTIQSLQDKIDSIKQHGPPGISANSKAGQQVIADYQAQIDALTQHKPPVL